MNVLPISASPSGSYTQPRAPSGWPPDPEQLTPFDGVPVSGYGTKRTPQAPWFENVLSMTVSLRPPDTVMPVPIGPAAAEPAAGGSGLLLSWTSLWMNTQHEWVCVIGLMPLSGQSPFCGGGGSPPTWVFVSSPSWLWSNCECSMTTAPPEFVPE